MAVHVAPTMIEMNAKRPGKSHDRMARLEERPALIYIYVYIYIYIYIWFLSSPFAPTPIPNPNYRIPFPSPLNLEVTVVIREIRLLERLCWR